MPAPFVRPATPVDSGAIGLVHVRSWQSAYRGKIPQDYLDGLDPTHRAQVWRRVLEQVRPSQGGVLVAVAEGGGITGFASFGFSPDGDTARGRRARSSPSMRTRTPGKRAPGPP